MARIAPAARPAFSLTARVREGWARLLRSSNKAMAKAIYTEDVVFTDSLERELANNELHPYSY